MNDWTQEPWEAIGPHAIAVVRAKPDSSGVTVMPCMVESELPDDMDAQQYYRDCKRTAACVNACKGLPTAALESGIVAELIDTCAAASAAISLSLSGGAVTHDMLAALADEMKALVVKLKEQP